MQPSDLTFTTQLSADLITVWRTLTHPAYVPRWLFGVTPDASPVGGRGYIYRSANGRAALAGTYVAVRPPALLTMSFRAVHSTALAAEPESLLQFSLREVGSGVQFELRHSRLEASPLTAIRAAADWPIALQSLSVVVSGLRTDP